MKYVEIIIIFAFLGLILASLKFTSGQSLAQVNNETEYRTELEAYVNLHNISFSAANGGNQLNSSNFDTLDLETVVKSHMEFCKSQNNMDARISSEQIRDTEWAIRVDRKLAFGDC